MANNGANGSPPSDPGCPPGWKEVPLTSVADIRFSGVDKVSRSGETPVRLCNYIDVYDNDYITAGMNFMRATATCAEIERFGLQIGDVIITKDSETPDDIGVPAVVDSSGVRDVIEIELTDEEKTAFKKSAQQIRNAIKKL